MRSSVKRGLRLVSAIVIGLVLGAAGVAAAELPELRLSARNAVPDCVTPERLEALLAEGNRQLDPRFKGIAAHYKSHGEQVGVRWDYAFYQMLVETNALSFKRASGIRRDAKPELNNFASIGTSGSGEESERFKDVATGVLAHLQHIRVYTGDPVERAVARRSRDIQSFIVPWAKGLKRPATFRDLASRWAPQDPGYADAIEEIAEAYRQRHCAGRPDENVAMRAKEPPQLKAEDEDSAVEPSARSKTSAKSSKRRGKKSSEESETARTTEPIMNKELSQATKADDEEDTPAEIEQKALKAAQKSPAAPKAPVQKPDQSPAEKRSTAPSQTASVTPTKAPTTEAEPVPPQATKDKAANCRVWTASFGGDHAILIKVLEAGITSYTALEVNSTQAQEQTVAFIAAYAKGGIKVGEFKSREEALARAFELCPQS